MTEPDRTDPTANLPSVPAPRLPAAARAVDLAARVEVVLAGTELRISGRLDRTCASRVRDVLQAAVDSGTGDLVVHLGDVEVTDAAGLGVLVGVDRRARLAQRRLVLIGVPVRLERLIRHTRLHRVLVRAQAVALA